MFWSNVRSGTRKVWAWLKRYWRWLLFPIGALLALAGFLAGTRRKVGVDTPVGPSPDDVDHAWSSGGHAVDATVEADRKRDEALEALRKQNEARLQSLSVEQREELDRLKERPIEEVVSWFDKL